MGCEVCTEFLSGGLRTPPKDIDYAVMSPFVEVTVSASGKKITVGLNSMPPDNSVSILSFEYGAVGVSGTGGLSIKVELIDEKGGEFYKFAESLWTCMNKDPGSTSVTTRWGWIGKKCDGSPEIKTSPPVTAILVSIDVNFAEGKFKYTLTGTDIGPVSQHARCEETFGSENNKIPITQAIRDLCAIPPKCNVTFPNLRKGGSLIWEDGTEEGPKHYWPCKQGSKIQVINSWIHDFMTKDKKGLVVLNDNTQKDPTLIVTEQMKLEEGEQYSDSMSLGTFIVNGGECSLVLDFTTNFNWLLGIPAHDAGGGVDQNGQALKAHASYNDSVDATPQQPNAGVSTQTVVNQRSLDTRSQEDAGEQQGIANRENNKTTTAPGGGSPIEAQLRIMGIPDDDFVFPIFRGKLVCGIIVVNPFGLSQEGTCANWLQTSLCNKVLSNKYWVIEGCNHMIKDGNYTTTFKLTLPVPMISFTPGTPIGGPGSAGYSDFKC